MKRTKESQDAFSEYGERQSHRLTSLEDQSKPTKAKKQSGGFRVRVEHYFKFDTFKATLKKELIGGITMFLAVLYILSVEPQMLHAAVSNTDPTNAAANMNEFGVFLAMCIATFLSTFVMGLFANIPVIVAPSMGVNAMFVFNIANAKGGIGYEGALIATTISSILFVIFSITPLRRLVIEAIPKSLQIGIGVGIGFFVAYVGIADIGWTGMNDGTPFASIGDLKHNYPQIILGSGLFLLMLFFHFKKIKGGVAISMLTGLVIALIVANVGPNLAISGQNGAFNTANFIDNPWNAQRYDFAGFKSNIVNTWSEFIKPDIWEKPVMYISIFMFIFLNFFDATGTLMTFNNELNKLSGQDRPLPNSAMVIDSGATVVGSALGVSPLGAFVESGSGIAVGARTGLASIFASFGFLISIAIFPIFQAVPTCVSGAACVFVGVSMMASIMDIDWKKPEFAISVFLGIVFMVVTYTITNGIAIMFIVYTFIMMCKKHFKKVPIAMYVLSVLFIGYFVAYAFML